MTEPELVEKIQTLQLEPGSVLVLRGPVGAGAHLGRMVMELRRDLARRLGFNVPVYVFEPSIEIEHQPATLKQEVAALRAAVEKLSAPIKVEILKPLSPNDLTRIREAWKQAYTGPDAPGILAKPGHTEWCTRMTQPPAVHDGECDRCGAVVR